jgi:hypothetical protein
MVFFSGFKEYNQAKSGVFTITCTLSLVMFFVLIAFAGWNWFLAFTG